MIFGLLGVAEAVALGTGWIRSRLRRNHDAAVMGTTRGPVDRRLSDIVGRRPAWTERAAGWVQPVLVKIVASRVTYWLLVVILASDCGLRVRIREIRGREGDR